MLRNALLRYYSVLQSATPLLLCTTKSYSGTTPVLLRTTKYYSTTTPYYKVLLQYYSVLQSATPLQPQYYSVPQSTTLAMHYKPKQSTSQPASQFGRPAGEHGAKTAGRPAGWQGAGRPAGDEIANKSTVLSTPHKKQKEEIVQYQMAQQCSTSDEPTSHSFLSFFEEVSHSSCVLRF